MKLVERFWTAVTHVLNILLLSPFGGETGDGVQQHPLHELKPTLASLATPFHPLTSPVHPHASPLPSLEDTAVDYPSFIPPGFPLDPEHREQAFRCEYEQMKGWRACSESDRRGCWIENTGSCKKGEVCVYNINTDYEKYAPIGKDRYYSLYVDKNETLNLDGMINPGSKLFNNQYPGPWLQACWGDTIHINVTVAPTFKNGTAVHWHGIRQYQTLHMDGVPGVTQCPIAPGSWFVYTWKALQYGSSWYHSHYSLQYADGLLGPLTIHGPSTASYDVAATLPLLVTDWNHVSAFKVPYLGALLPTTLLNGIGNITKTYLKDGKLTKTLPEVKDMRPPTDIIFERGKKYLLRVINTAYDATFLFTIDNHLLTVVAADFVPISPYTAKSITVGIGQRYDIIVEANPLTVEPNTELTAQGHPEKNGSNPVQPDGNYWIRTYMIDECFGSTLPGNNYEEVGIVRYDHANKNTNALSSPWPGMDTKTCQGEMGWKPWFPWVIGANPVNPDRDRHDVHGFIPETDKTPYPLARFSLQSDPLGFAPLRLNYSNITFGNLENTGGWPEPWVVVEENGTVNDWIYLAVTAGVSKRKKGAAHPIHLHGHDFAVLAQSNETYNVSTVKLNLYNPQRRDVILLPSGGYIVIAFKVDNPGAWLMHCHIAEHASMGLALQLLENRAEAAQMWPAYEPARIAAEEVCSSWKTWVNNCTNHWNKRCDVDGKWGERLKDPWLDDSGI